MLAFKYGPSQILNMDETLLCVIGHSVRMVRFTSTTARAAGDLKKSRLNTVGSFTPVVNALGETLLRVYCMKAPKSHNGALDLPIDKDGKALTVPPTTLPLFLKYSAPEWSQTWRHALDRHGDRSLKQSLLPSNHDRALQCLGRRLWWTPGTPLPRQPRSPSIAQCCQSCEEDWN